MDPDFWHDKWERGDIGFHETRANPSLIAHFPKVAPSAPAVVFVPLCGKTRDIAWLLEQGYQVVGAELSERAIIDLFHDLGIAPEIERYRAVSRFSGPDVTIFVGDIFDLTRANIGIVDIVYDRAALVALPYAMRAAYAQQVAALSGEAPQLLLCFEYDQHVMTGPPFSVDQNEIRRVYGEIFDIDNLGRKPISGPLKTRLSASRLADHTAWHLS
ncbi:thiopurine S-methyltransferase [Cognatiyoonia sp. IB215446]|uniref:thiopurine S-methyltransferase n=1 Tax=Cognatiyoonia sp. IB215446 TaxID=3097355 RepID=UPI002A153133|nr:thiopurine S-methyltransferase [Cognatiyoonia sp. IB215446]MDX8350699.1 thiopurine S-methyltransferase [Cognatiyoonia sp. IB215446]